jgi:hypothetical protein
VSQHPDKDLALLARNAEPYGRDIIPSFSERQKPKGTNHRLPRTGVHSFSLPTLTVNHRQPLSPVVDWLP